LAIYSGRTFILLNRSRHDQRITDVGYAGLFAEWDSRNSIFTPNKEILFRVMDTQARNWLGSDDDYEQLEIFTNVFFQPFKPWVWSFMEDWNMMSDDAPFSMFPYLTMQGLPAAKYQGKKTSLSRRSNGSISSPGGV
jgi:hypothetical protein